MSVDENRSLVRRYIDEILIRGDMTVADELLAQDYKRYTSASSSPLTVEAQKQRLAGMRAAFPGWKITVEDMLAEGSRVSFRVTIRGTQNGPFLNIPPTGKPITVWGLDVVRIENGKLVEHWGGPDVFDALRQLGALVIPG
jgi:steroid delta-isomerase-like uncharacterized protein